MCYVKSNNQNLSLEQQQQGMPPENMLWIKVSKNTSNAVICTKSDRNALGSFHDRRSRAIYPT